MSTDVKLRLAVDGDAQAVKAIGSVERALGSLDGVAGLAKTGLLALGSSLSVSAFIGITRTFIDSADALNDMSQRVGIAVRDLAKYELAAAQSGTTMEALSKGIKGLSVNMMENGESLKKAGITATNADAAMQQLADLFATMPDGMEKTTLAVKMFGKSGMDMIPMLNLGSKGLQDAADKSAAYAAQMAAMAPLADAFNDNMAQIGMSSKVVGMTMVNEALPGLLKISTAMAEASVTGGAFAAVMAGISAGFENYKSNVREFWGMQQPSTGGATGSWGEPDKKDPVKEWRKSYEELIAAMGKSSAGADASKRVNDELKKQSDLLAKLSGYSSSYEEDARRLVAMFNSGKLSTQAYNGAINELVNSQPGIKQGLADQAKALADTAKATEEARKATAQYYDSLAKGLDALDNSNQKLRDQVEEIGITSEALNTLRLARLDAAIAQEEEIYTMASAHEAGMAELLLMQKRINLLKEQRTLTATGQNKQAQADSAKAAMQAWEKAAQQIENSISNALLRGFESGKGFAENLRDTVVNMFKTMVLRPVVEIGVRGGMSALGLGGLSGAANAASGLGSLPGLAGVASAFGGALSSGFTLAINGGLGAALEGGAAMLGSATGFSSAMASIGQLAGALGPIALGLAAIPAISGMFDGGREYTTGSGIAGAFSAGGFSGRNYQNWKNDGDSGFFGIGASGSSSGTNYSAIDTTLQTTLGTAFGAIISQTAGFAASLGASASDVMAYSENINLALGSDAAANQKAIEELLKGVSVRAAATVVEAQYTRAGETAADTLARLATTLTVVNGTFSAMGKPLLGISQAGGSAASKLVDLFGGLDQFTASTQAYYSAYFTEQERMAKTSQDVAKALAAVGVAMPSSKASFRAIAESLDLTTDYGQKTFKAMMELAPAFAQTADAADKLATSIKGMLTSTSSLVDDQIQRSKSAATQAHDTAKAYADAGAALRKSSQGLFASVLTGSQTLAYTKQQFDVAAAQAKGGNVTAMGTLGDSATSYVDAAKAQAVTRTDYLRAAIFAQQQLEQAAATADVMGLGADYQAKLYDVNTAMLEVLAENLKSDSVDVALAREQLTALERLSATIADSSTLSVQAITTSNGQIKAQLVDNAGRTVAQLSSDTALQLAAMGNQTSSLVSAQGISIAGLSSTLSSTNAAAILAADTNRDGIVSALELQRITTLDGTTSLIGSLTKSITASGQLTANQVRVSLQDKASNADVNALIAAVDTNRDGIITRAELDSAKVVSTLNSSTVQYLNGLAKQNSVAYDISATRNAYDTWAINASTQGMANQNAVAYAINTDQRAVAYDVNANTNAVRNQYDAWMVSENSKGMASQNAVAYDVNVKQALTFSNIVSGQTLKLGQFTQAELSGLQGVKDAQNATNTTTDIVAQATNGSETLLGAVLRKLGAQDTGSGYVVDAINKSNLAITDSLTSVLAAIKNQSESSAAAAKLQRDLSNAQVVGQNLKAQQASTIASVNTGITGIHRLASAYGLQLQNDSGGAASFNVNAEGLFNANYASIYGNTNNAAAFKRDFYSAGGVNDQTYGKVGELATLHSALATARETVRSLGGIPTFAVGTNYLPSDMLAQVHKGERIIPAADNRALMQRLQSPQQNSDALVAEIRALRAELEGLRAEARATAVSNSQLAKDLRSIKDRGLTVKTDSDTPLDTRAVV